MNSSEFAWLIPCRNEEHTIGGVIDEIRKVTPLAPIYVCDNGSTDLTAKIAQGKGAQIINEENIGKGFALRRLFAHVGAPIFIVVDGDGTYEIGAAPKLLAAIQRGECDMAVGSRLESADTLAFRLFHKMGNQFIGKLVRSIYGSKLRDFLSGYRAIKRDSLNSLPLRSKGFEVEVEISILAIRHGFRVLEIPTKYGPRASNSSSKLRTFRDGVRIVTTILQLLKQRSLVSARPRYKRPAA